VGTNNVAHVFIDGAGSSTPLPFDRVAEPRGISVAPWGDLIISESDYGVIRVVRRKLAVSDVGHGGGAGCSLTWYSMPSIPYEVEFTQDLLSTHWLALATVPGAAAHIATGYTDTNAVVQRSGVYRIHAAR
jgi:hypothetical protein